MNLAVLFKAVRNTPLPYDVPAELQRLSVESEAFASAGAGLGF
jgi:hypothetical protein